DGVQRGLDAAALSHGEIRWYATPRRLAVYAERLARAQKDRKVERRGPAFSVAYDSHGKPTKAAKGFAESCGMGVDKLQILENNKGKWVVARYTEHGRSTAEIIPEIISDVLQKLPIPRRMRWGEGEVEFVRPVHWVVLLHGNDVIEATILGVRSDRKTYGHRFHFPKPIILHSPKEYLRKLEQKGYVIANYQQRRERIENDVQERAATIGNKASIEPELLDEVTALVEWPQAILGHFSAELVDLPPEVLVAVLQNQQRYFPVTKKSGELAAHFISVSNIKSDMPGMMQLGNEKVIMPRLRDAEFFWKRDQNRPLADYRDELKGVIFQKELGSVYSRTERLARLSAKIAGKLKLNVEHARRAGELSKCDLVTEMVNEIPDLQGIMGHYYAKSSNEPETVALALSEQYMPRFAGDKLPVTGIGQVLSIADKLDILVGIFAIGQMPTGERDPFGLRRAALGVIRILIEKLLPLDIVELFDTAKDDFAIQLPADISMKLHTFFMDRLRPYLLERGYAPDEIEAVLALNPGRLDHVLARLDAVKKFRKLPEGMALSAANKRIRNILRQADPDLHLGANGYELRLDGDTGIERKPELLREDVERKLDRELESAMDEVEPMLRKSDYASALKRLAALRPTVDNFFDKVMVMVDNTDVRNNRLALLKDLGNLFLRVADVSRLQG
ncbi:MAG: glycine--tRNA ligase subunit beta, partial [Gammaproteobacteria bacterium]|nr:glycine--tRNA ligase subunit beta [Gammaproteobacteria bacterium]